MDGTVLELDLKNDAGLIRGTDGRRYAFKTTECRNGIPLPGNKVDFEPNDGEAAELYVTGTPMSVRADWLFWFLFSFRGRISRDQFFMFLTGGLAVTSLFALAATWSSYGGYLFPAGFILMLYIKSCVVVKRFHDSGAGGGWLLFTLILGLFLALVHARVIILPFFGGYAVPALLSFFGVLVLFCLYLCFTRGNVGENRYGAKPYTCRTLRTK